MIRSTLYRATAFTMVLALVNLSVPLGLANTFGPNPFVKVAKPAPKVKPKQQETKYLSAHEMRALSGRQSPPAYGQNPYLAGSGKWGIQYNGVDLLTGNFTQSVTDLTFDTGYGIPVNVTRSYSSNTYDESAVGWGWSLSVDVRSTAGGVFKSSAAPIMSVPVGFKERPAAQTNDPNAPMGTQPVAAVVATDAAGTEETIQKDVDGILTTPPWDNNTINTTYEYVTTGGNTYQILQSNSTVTPDGTTYNYSVHGSYTGGTTPYMGTASGEPSNVLKIDSAADRQGNVTNYYYNQGGLSPQTFSKYNGVTSEDCLTEIKMPGGHTIQFVWGDTTIATNYTPTNRIYEAYDNGGNGPTDPNTRTVTYGYGPGNTDLTSVTSPGKRKTIYAYGSASSVNSDPNPANNLLTSITDPRGLTTTIEYATGQINIPPYNVSMNGVGAYHVHDSLGVDHYTQIWTHGAPSDFPPTVINPSNINLFDMVGGPHGTLLRSTQIERVVDPVNAYYTVGMMNDLPASNALYFGEPFGTTAWYKTYDAYTEDLLEEVHYTDAMMHAPLSNMPGDLSSSRQMTLYNTAVWKTDQVNSYNFMGNPLSQTINEYQNAGSGFNQTNSTTTGYAYWGQDKYFQQMATKDNVGRYTFTDYYPNTAGTPAGSIGNKHYVYGPNNPNYCTSPPNQDMPPMPSGIAPSDQWRYQLQAYNPATQGNPYSGAFAYDSLGRLSDAWKVQSTPNNPPLNPTTNSPWTYVQMHTQFGGNGAPTWGQSTTVTEDYGGPNARTTQSMAYKSWGTASDFIDAAGHEFVTSFDNDGNVLSIQRTDIPSRPMLVTNVFGTSGFTNDMPTSVTDGLTGVTQTVTYQSNQALPGYGLVASVQQSGGANPGYTVSYTYTPAGDRSVVTYSNTADGTIAWQYGDYEPVGSFDQNKRVYQTLNRLNANNSMSAEEMHYSYDSAGRPREIAFAQSPQNGSGAPTSAPFYTASYPAASRAITFYDYDGYGRQTNVQQGWQVWAGGGYGATQCILANSCLYDLSRNLKKTSSFFGPTAGNPTVWTQTRQESYGYDGALDCLTSANYGDGLPNATPSWLYDAAGNRTDSAVDNLNRTTSIGGLTTLCDALGNRTKLGSSTTYSWDCLNRMTGFTSSGSTANYEYRGDGLRTHKTTGTGFSEYYQDGQMPIEDAVVNGTSITVTRYGLGVRGIDYEEVATGSYSGGTRALGAFSSVLYPLYDLYGNMIGTLSRSGTGNYSINNQRSYDAWGVTRQGATTGDPKNRYCGSLGHQQDDESSLVYMRARYYEASSGRFISQDSNMSGLNWFAYAKNNPISYKDPSGNEPLIGPVLDLIKIYLKSMGIDIKDLPKDSQIRLALAECIVNICSCLTLANFSADLAAVGIEGLGGGIFTGNPLIAGLCGVAACLGLMGMAVALVGAALALYNLGLEIYTLEALDGDDD